MILSLTSSTSRGGAALLAADGRLLAQQVYVDARGHGERLLGTVDQLLTNAGAQRRDLRGIVCDVGPGSFTGLRVALAATHGIALALGLPVAGVSSLRAMAHAASAQLADGATVTACLDAFKSEVFMQTFPGDGPRALGLEAARSELAARAVRGEVLVGEVLEALLPGVALRGSALDLPDPSWLGRLGLAQGLAREVLTPVYVRAPDARPVGPTPSPQA